MNFELAVWGMDGLPHLYYENPLSGDDIDIVLWDGAAWLVDFTDIDDYDYESDDDIDDWISRPESWCEIDLTPFLLEFLAFNSIPRAQ